MGCCQSSPSPYGDRQPHNSRSHINNPSRSQSQSALPRPSTNNSNVPDPASAGSGFAPRHSDSRTNTATRQTATEPVKLKAPKQWTTRPEQKAWTRQTLDKERKAFFDTRVTGRQEIWAALHFAVGELWAGGDEDAGLATAQTFLDAAEIKVSDGDLTKVMYDQFGNMYDLPRHIVSDPQNLGISLPRADVDGSKESGEGEGESEETEDEETIQRRREEKGKAVVREGDVMKAKVRFSASGLPDRIISFSRRERVRAVSQHIIAEVPQLMPPKKIKLFFLGKPLEENNILGEILEETRSRLEGFKESDEIVISAMVFSPPS